MFEYFCLLIRVACILLCFRFELPAPTWNVVFAINLYVAASVAVCKVYKLMESETKS